MLEAYIDESENDRAKPRIFVVAGWFGHADAWRPLEEAWQIALADAGVDEFHSADCLAGYGLFSGLDEDSRTKLRLRLIQLIRDSRTFGVTTTLTLDETGGRVPKRKEYEYCIGECMAMMALMADTYPLGERIGFLVDERAHTQELFNAWRDLRADPDLSVSRRLGPAAFYSRREVIPLQAADLLAHEVYLQRLNEIQLQKFRPEFGLLRPHMNRVVLHWDHASKRLHDYMDYRPDPS